MGMANPTITPGEILYCVCVKDPCAVAVMLCGTMVVVNVDGVIMNDESEALEPALQRKSSQI